MESKDGKLEVTDGIRVGYSLNPETMKRTGIVVGTVGAGVLLVGAGVAMSGSGVLAKPGVACTYAGVLMIGGGIVSYRDYLQNGYKYGLYDLSQ
ncbi:hypothetical protein [Thermospira aquatica]|uniref:Transmembrane protein n=1 Tax=Thermospira aquatica TaxID=2828656 RepID=A0AAX3BGP4_9SPIR|nr:hypothetical protein [Thermospira aquatica]URA10621.1 hypothetical protein KDW03_02110 [Thermospira aquatica]